MSGVEPQVGATSGSSAAVLPPPPPPPQQQQQQQQEITAAQFSDAILEIFRQQKEILENVRQQQEMTAAQFSDAIREIIKQQQQQEITAAARSWSDELRGWLMFVVTLTASVTYSVALNPPGGFWQDGAKGRYAAGRPALSDKFHTQYMVFYYCNFTSFMSSLIIFVLLSNPCFYDRIPLSYFNTFVALDILAWAGAFIAGSTTTWKGIVGEASFISGVLGGMAFDTFVQRHRTSRHESIDQSGQSV